jgi:hypothetical protein
MHRTIRARSHHLCDATRIVAIGLVDLRLQCRSHVPRLNTLQALYDVERNEDAARIGPLRYWFNQMMWC